MTKALYLSVVFFILTQRVSAQRHFTLVDATHRDTLIYMNDSTGRYIPILIENLRLDHSNIKKVSCGNKEPIRTSLLHNGLAVIIDTTKANERDLGYQNAAKSKRVGLWSQINFFHKEIIQQQSKITAQSNSKKIEHSEFLSITKSIRSSASYSLNDSDTVIEEPFDVSKLFEQRVYRYRYTQRNNLYFRKLFPDSSKEAIGIPLNNLSVDYHLIDTIVCHDRQTILTVLLQIGSVGLKYPNDKKLNHAEREAFFYAQNNRLGIWKNFRPNFPETMIPNIKAEDKNPPNTEDPDKVPPTLWTRFKLFLHRGYDGTLGQLGGFVQIVTVLGSLLGILGSALYVIDRRKKGNG